MDDKKKTKEQLIAELEELRKRNDEPGTTEPEFKKEKDTLIKDNEFFQQIFYAMDDPIYVMDENYRFIYLNKKSCDVWKRDKKELLNKTIFDLYENNDAIKHKEEHDLVFETRKPATNDFEVELHGEKYTYSILKSLLTNSEKDEKFIVGICRDITERKNLKMNAQKQVNSNLSDFLQEV